MRRSTTLVIIAGCVIGLVTFGVRSSFGLFTEPLSLVRGWDREALRSRSRSRTFVWGLGQPVAGAVADRFGAGRVLTVGASLRRRHGADGRQHDPGRSSTLTGGVLIGLGWPAARSWSCWRRSRGSSPEDRRSLVASGLATAAGSIGQFLFAPLGQAFISATAP